MQTVFLECAHGKQSVNASFQTVTRLRDRACQGWRAIQGNSGGIRGKCKAERGARGQLVSDNPTYWDLGTISQTDESIGHSTGQFFFSEQA